MKLGKTQRVIIKRITKVGAFVNLPERMEQMDDVLLPKKFLDSDWKVGDEISVFVLKDSEDRIVATTQKPKAEVGEFAFLEVTSVTKIGAFLDWGLDKDLFLPFEGQKHHVKQREKVFVYIYVDKSERLCGTMNVVSHFLKPSKLKKDMMVKAQVYSVNPEIGAFVVIEGKYNGMISTEKMRGALNIGETVTGKIENIKHDGKIDLSIIAPSFEYICQDSKNILAELKKNNGFLPYNDNSKPEDIKKKFGISKAQFKRSLGALLKSKEIEIVEDGIKLLSVKERKYNGRKK